jgi:hypothetical protein
MEDSCMRQLDGQRRSTGRPNLNERTALSESMADIDAQLASLADLMAVRSLEEARAAWQAREEVRAGHARTLSTAEVERELDLGPA